MSSDIQERLKNLSPEKRARVLAALRQDVREKSSRIQRRRQQASAPVSFAQQRLWFIHQLEPGLCAYNFLLAARLKGKVNVAALERSFNEIIRRHETLRTSFTFADTQPLQVIAPEYRLTLPVVDLREEPEERRAAVAERLMMEQVEQPFDLGSGPLLRVKLLRLGEAEYLVVLVMHHIISDGWSMGLLLGELGRLYEGYVVGRETVLEKLPIQYGDYAEWQRNWLSGAVLEEQLGYWRRQLAGMAALQLPTDRPRPPVQSFRGATYSFDISAELTAALRALSKRAGITLFMTLMATLQTLFYRYTGQEDMTVSTGSSNRNHPDTEALIGCFINILLLRSDLSGNPTFLELLSRVHKVAMDAYEHQDLPFELLVDALRPERDLSYNPLSQVMLVLHNVPAEPRRLNDLVIEPVTAERTTAQLDLNLQIWERADGLTGMLEYDKDLFDHTTMTRMIEHFRILLEGITLNPAQRLAELPLLSKAEEDQLLVQFNSTKTSFPDVCLHQLFESKVEVAPGALAVIGENDSLTYQELNRRANRVAHHLRELGVGLAVRVAICVERSLEMVIGLVGTLKAGAAIVPLDPSYPKDRLAFMLQDAQVAVLLTQRHLTERLPDYEGHLVELDAQLDSHQQPATNENPDSGVTPNDLAYVIYTSGSTGLPKAVMLNHKGRVNNFFDFNQRFRIGAGDRLIALSSLSFDMTAYDVFGTLASGGAIVIPEAAKERDPPHWAGLMQRHNVTIWHSAPALLEMLVQQVEARPELAPRSLRLVLLGGDWIPLSLPGRLKNHVPGVTVISLGGATEASMDSTIYSIEKIDPSWKSIPYGQPMANQTSYILDTHLQPVPIGVPGELHLGGVGVAWWYHNRPTLSAEKFIPDPFSTEPGARLYKTGDLARHMLDGNMELLGRIDHQVKLRGLRIELGEIVSALRQHPDIKEAVALVREDEPENKYLVAYIVPQTEVPLAAGELRGFLKEKLPEYMVPSFFVTLTSLPLTPNGKIDRRSLPAPDTTKRESATEFVAPRTPVEEVVAGIWADVLRREQVSIHDGFFDLGGHSLMATQVISRLQSSYNIELPLRQIFEAPTVSGLAQAIEAMLLQEKGISVSRPPMIPRRSVVSPIQLSFAQQRLWFLDQIMPPNAAFNTPAVARLKGEVNVAALERSFNEIIRRHETLRTSFTFADTQPLQVIAPEYKLTLPVVDLREEPEDKRVAVAERLMMEEVEQPFDLRCGPLLRVKLLRLAEAEYLAVVVIHHIISDGWSMGLLFGELARLYEGFALGRDPALEELPIQYGDYAEWQRNWLSGAVLEEQLGYWRRQLAGMATLQLPTDRPRPPVQSFRGDYLVWKLPSLETERLNSLSRQEGVTLFMTLAVAFAVLLHHLTEQLDIVIGTDVANRNHVQIEKLIGFFVNQLVLRFNLSGNPTFRELLKRTQRTTLEAYAHQELPFEMVVAALQPARQTSRMPLFQVKLVLQNFPSDQLELPSLTLTPVPVPIRTSKYDLLFNINENSQGLAGTLEYDTELFDGASISRLLRQYESVLRQVIAQPETRLTMLARSLVESPQATTEEHQLADTSLLKLRGIKRRPVAG